MEMNAHKMAGVVFALLGLCLVWGRAAMALPPRPDQPVATPTPYGGAIELCIEGFEPGLWAVVQWQDGLGGWHDVEGWRGEPATANVIWWVSPRDFATGPFRWAVYDEAGGELLAASDPFDLPSWHGELVRVGVSVP